MKNAVIGLVTLAAFAAGLFGIKMVLAPDAAAEGDELDPAAALLAEGDTLSAADALEAATGLPLDSAVALPFPDAPIGELERLRAQIALTQKEIPQLLERLDELEQQATARQERYEQAREIASSVSRLEDRDLRELLVRLDAGLLTDIYVQASARNRTKLLQALPASVGAALLEQIAYGSSRPRVTNASLATPSRAARPDSAATSSAE